MVPPYFPPSPTRKFPRDGHARPAHHLPPTRPRTAPKCNPARRTQGSAGAGATRRGEDARVMKVLRRLYAKRGFGDPASAMVADGLLLAAVAAAAFFVWVAL